MCLHYFNVIPYIIAFVLVTVVVVCHASVSSSAPPSPELVDRVRELYHRRVDDVRFLIPVLTGLTKQEVISALPQLIKLNPVVVKEVFNRLVPHDVISIRTCY